GLRLPAPPAADRLLRGDPRVLPRPGGTRLGRRDRGADRGRAGRPAPARVQAVPVDAGDGPAAARDQGAAGEVQGRPRAPQPGDDEVLPGEQGQPAGLLPADHRAAPGVPRALLHAAGGSAARHLPEEEPARHRRSGPLWSDARLRLLLHSRPHEQGDGLGPRRPDRALRRDAARLERHVDRQHGSQPAAADARPALPLRGLHLELPGGPARLLDHHERLDDRAAGDHQVAPGAVASPGRAEAGGSVRAGFAVLPEGRPGTRRQAGAPSRGRRRGRRRRRRTEGPAVRSAAAFAAQEEEALGAPAM
ncbi:MAG: Inner membrane protein translocase component YidC, long form, partial [uncultured Solirubrobacteraceae bacterium]